MKICNFCKTDAASTLFVIHGIAIVKCRFCGLVYADCELEAPPETIYNESYFNEGEYWNYSGDRTLRAANANDLLNVLKKYLPSGSLLECGCAYGFFLDAAREQWAVSGIELCGEAAGFAQSELKLDVICSDIKPALENKPAQDIICMWDVIEHLSDPTGVLKAIHGRLNNHGYLCLTTGDIGSLFARLRGRHWRLLHPPTHLYYFSEKWFRDHLPALGYEVVLARHIGVRRSFSQTIYELLLKHICKTRTAGKVWPSKLNFSYYLNLYDISLVIARKCDPYMERQRPTAKKTPGKRGSVVCSGPSQRDAYPCDG